ncbi:MAG: 50S ribosomal protein L4 [Puniceicoccaceae bacterium]
MKLKLYSKDASTVTEKDFAIPAFEGTRGLQALRQVIIAVQANQRQGNASTKTRGEVSGSGKKPFRQKGTGSARQGSRRSPLWRKGGVVFGPKPRDYSQKINKKMKRLALQRAIFDSASTGGLEVIEAWEIAEAKTRLFDQLIGKMVPQGTVLVVDDRFEGTTALASRNIERVHVGEAADISPVDIARFKKIVISEKGLEALLERVNGKEAS